AFLAQHYAEIAVRGHPLFEFMALAILQRTNPPVAAGFIPGLSVDRTPFGYRRHATLPFCYNLEDTKFLSDAEHFLNHFETLQDRVLIRPLADSDSERRGVLTGVRQDDFGNSVDVDPAGLTPVLDGGTDTSTVPAVTPAVLSDTEAFA